ncbi:MAG: hypothetical protein KGJ02_04115 [Verrucomicrobiota bacterium]|nr:hypothetical protein [Verrucomicrobiota bacterium]
MTPATLSNSSIIARITIYGLFLNLLCGCYRSHLYVQQEVVNRDFLASTHVGTPDPRQAHPPEGQRLLISWDFPKKRFEQGLTLIATIRLWDNTQKSYVVAIERKRGYEAIDLPMADKEHRILTYLVQVVNRQGEVVDQWKHHFWTELIKVGSRNEEGRSIRK